MINTNIQHGAIQTVFTNTYVSQEKNRVEVE